MAKKEKTLTEHIGKKKTTHYNILHCAKQLFERYGTDDVTADAIAEESGVCRSTFFNHFASINLLLQEIARTEIDDLLAACQRSNARGRALIEILMSRLIDDTIPYPQLTVKLLMSRIMSGEEVNPLKEIENMVLTAINENGVNSEFSPMEAVALILGSYYGVIFQQFIDRKPFNNVFEIKTTVYKTIRMVLK